MIRKTLQEISDAGFQQQQGPNAWYFPEGVNHPNTARIHIGGSINHAPPPSMEIDFVSIGPHGAGQRLHWNAGTHRWDLNTPGVNWYSYRGEMENVLTRLGIAS
jgi:hypothetical protein